MPQDETVSEAEVEAAARVMAELCETSVIEAPKLPWPCWMGTARSILTAAAQVRERGGELAATPQQVRDLEAYTESIARALHEAHMPYCDYTYPFEDPMSSNDMYRELARAVTLVRGPALMPIYGATEDPTAAELAVGQIVRVITVADDGVKTERVPWSEIMNPSIGERVMSEKPDLETRVRQFERMELPGQMRAMHMGTAYLVNDLWREVQRLQALVAAPCFSGAVTEPDSGPDVLGERKE